MTRLFLLLALLTATACSDAANDGRYATHDRGRSNNRADVPVAQPLLQAQR